MDLGVGAARVPFPNSFRQFSLNLFRNADESDDEQGSKLGRILTYSFLDDYSPRRGILGENVRPAKRFQTGKYYDRSHHRRRGKHGEYRPLSLIVTCSRVKNLAPIES